MTDEEVIIEKIDTLTGDLIVIDPKSPKWYEIVEYKGEDAKHYPYTGAFISVATGKILGNEGGRVDFDGSALATLHHTSRREAIIDGLTKAAIEGGFGVVPTAMLSEIVRKRAEVAATNSGRAGNDAAKLILQLADFIEDDSKEKGAALSLSMDGEIAREFVKGMIALAMEKEE